MAEVVKGKISQIDRKAFFAHVRSAGVAGKPLKEKSVISLNAILDSFEREFPKGPDLRWVGYAMATSRGEAWDWRKGRGYIDCEIQEVGGPSKDYGKEGFWGRGLSQLTHKENYKRAGDHFGVDLVKNPDLALKPDISAGCLVVGSYEGWFRGDSKGRHKFSRYFNETTEDPFGAREIINGDKNVTRDGEKIGERIKGYYMVFMAAIRVALAPPLPDPIQEVTLDSLQKEVAALSRRMSDMEAKLANE
jgi:glycosyl hydrolase family 19 (putative chitinase)